MIDPSDIGALICRRHINRRQWLLALRDLSMARTRSRRESMNTMLAAHEEFERTLNAAIALEAAKPGLELVVALQIATNANVRREVEAAQQACGLSAEERRLEAEKVRILDGFDAALAGLLMERCPPVAWRM